MATIIATESVSLDRAVQAPRCRAHTTGTGVAMPRDGRDRA